MPAALVVGALAFWLIGRITPAPKAAPPQPTGPVEASPRALSDADATACRALLATLPAQAGENQRRQVTGAAEQVAAYGDPAITVACGGPVRATAATDVLWPMGGVCWFGEPTPGANVWTTVDRGISVRVTVPVAHDGQLVAEFSPAVAAALPRVSAPPAACG